MPGLSDLFTPSELTAYRRLPRSLRVLVENALRNGYKEDAAAILARAPAVIRVTPTRLVMQDLLAVPLLADLASLRTELAARGANPNSINPRLPTDLVIDHSMTVEHYGTAQARRLNEEREIEINRERFTFLRWCAGAFENLRIIPPGNGIVHQINLEQLATCVVSDCVGGRERLYPELVIGNDSHTPMINGLGILGWGVGGLEAEIALLGRPLEIVTPKVVGVRLTGRLQGAASATDLALYLTELLRKTGVVDQFVEFFGPALAGLSVPDRATASNMAPEYGATCAYFPIDQCALDYLEMNGRAPALIEKVERMAKQLELWNDGNESLSFDRVLELHLDGLRPSVAGPAQPQDRVPLDNVTQAFAKFCPQDRRVEVPEAGRSFGNGDIVVASITSCTNTANPRAVVQAGLLARNAVKKGLSVPSGIKTSLAPGSLIVANYLAHFGLQESLDALGFNLVGFACTTCNGMSGPIEVPIANAIDQNELRCAAVLSGNRNFPGRIHPHAQANFIMSPALVVAYALAGTVRRDLTREPLGSDRDGRSVHLADIWPDEAEVNALTEATANKFGGNEIKASEASRKAWEALSYRPGALYDWDEASTYLKPSPYFAGTGDAPTITGLRPSPCSATASTPTTLRLSASSKPAARPANFFCLAAFYRKTSTLMARGARAPKSSRVLSLPITRSKTSSQAGKPAASRSCYRTAISCQSSTQSSTTQKRAPASLSSPGAITAAAPRATLRRRHRISPASKRSSRNRSNASTARTWSIWGSGHWRSTARTRSTRSGSPTQSAFPSRHCQCYSRRKRSPPSPLR